jgi:hypothetical protein
MNLLCILRVETRELGDGDPMITLATFPALVDPDRRPMSD